MIFNAEERETCMEEFLYQYNLSNLVKEKTCFKSINNLFIKKSTLLM